MIKTKYQGVFSLLEEMSQLLWQGALPLLTDDFSSSAMRDCLMLLIEKSLLMAIGI
jgi:hypothetical protein